MASDRLVLDSSFALEAILPTNDQWSDEAVTLIRRIATGDVDARVPWIFFAECAAVVTRRIRDHRHRLDADVGREFLEQLDGLGLHVDLTLDGAGFMHANAVAWNVGAADSLYLDVAQRMAIPIASRDRGMLAGARQLGVEVFTT